ncbi:MAG TPA: glycosyltransferase family 2 protein [Acetobacteraceae bacterium]|nr:glycosyltransferase family 2 protein [Acetobacteraceae bacterium]
MRTLESFSALDLAGVASFELIIVDNNSSDGTGEMIARFAEAAPFPVLCLFEEKPGVSLAKNRALELAAGDVILTTDDDCIVSPDWVKVAVRLFSENPLQIIGGRIEPYNKDHLPLSIKTRETEDRLASPYDVMGFIHGANLAFGREVVERIGGFDVRLGPGRPLQAAEDAEFIYRAFISGIAIVYEPSLAIQHDHGRTGMSEWRRVTRNYGTGAGAMMMKYLLQGRIDLLKAYYWGVRRLLRDRHAGAPQLPWIPEKIAVLGGALRFLLGASWRRAE